MGYSNKKLLESAHITITELELEIASLKEQLEKIDKIANDILMDASQYPDDELNQQAGDIRGIIHELTQNQSNDEI